MYIGRIITKGKNLETVDFVDITQQLNITDKTVPTLIIGKQNAEKICGKENVHVLDKKIEDNVYWTFGKLERRNDFERDLLAFNKMLIKKLFKNINYEYFNVYTTDYNDVKSLLTKIDKNKGNVCYVSDKDLYLLIGNTVYGISFRDLEYIGVNKDKVINRIKRNRGNKIITNDYFISKNMKKYLNNTRFMVPYIYFLTKN
jgi:hypothetical protein